MTCSWASCLFPSTRCCWILFLGEFSVPSRSLLHQEPSLPVLPSPLLAAISSRATIEPVLNLPSSPFLRNLPICLPTLLRSIPSRKTRSLDGTRASVQGTMLPMVGCSSRVALCLRSRRVSHGLPRRTVATCVLCTSVFVCRFSRQACSSAGLCFVHLRPLAVGAAPSLRQGAAFSLRAPH